MKKFLAAVSVFAASALVLTGCAGASPAGSLPKDFGGAVELESAWKSKATSETLTVIEQGKNPVTGVESVNTVVNVYNPDNEEKLAFFAAALPVANQGQVPELYKNVVKTTGYGERNVTSGSVSNLFGPGVAQSIGLEDTSVLIVISDVTTLRAVGKSKELPSGFPTLKLGNAGEPTLTMPKSKAPSELRIANSIEGSGATVTDGSEVRVQYQGSIWKTGKVFDSSWERGEPAAFVTNQVIPGFTKALVGQRVGSQVVVIIPPDQGYGKDGNAGAGIKGTDTLVFVVDILATYPPQQQ